MADLDNAITPMQTGDILPDLATWQARARAAIRHADVYAISSLHECNGYHVVLCSNWDTDGVECDAGSAATIEPDDVSVLVQGITTEHNQECTAYQTRTYVPPTPPRSPNQVVNPQLVPTTAQQDVVPPQCVAAAAAEAASPAPQALQTIPPGEGTSDSQATPLETTAAAPTLVSAAQTMAPPGISATTSALPHTSQTQSAGHTIPPLSTAQQELLLNQIKAVMAPQGSPSHQIQQVGIIKQNASNNAQASTSTPTTQAAAKRLIKSQPMQTPVASQTTKTNPPYQSKSGNQAANSTATVQRAVSSSATAQRPSETAMKTSDDHLQPHVSPMLSASATLTPAARNQGKNQNNEGVLNWLQQQNTVQVEQVVSPRSDSSLTWPNLYVVASQAARIGTPIKPGSAPPVNTSPRPSTETSAAKPAQSLKPATFHSSKAPSMTIPTSTVIDRSSTPTNSTPKPAAAVKSSYTPKNDPNLPPHKRNHLSTTKKNDDAEMQVDVTSPVTSVQASKTKNTTPAESASSSKKPHQPVSEPQEPNMKVQQHVTKPSDQSNVGGYKAVVTDSSREQAAPKVTSNALPPTTTPGSVISSTVPVTTTSTEAIITSTEPVTVSTKSVIESVESVAAAAPASAASKAGEFKSSGDMQVDQLEQKQDASTSNTAPTSDARTNTPSQPANIIVSSVIMRDSSATRSPSPMKDSAVSVGKYYFNKKSLEESMKEWHDSSYPNRAEHAGMIIEKPGPYDAPYVICRARHEKAVMDCPLKITFAMMEDKQTCRVVSAVTEHSGSCNLYASGRPIVKKSPKSTAPAVPQTTFADIAKEQIKQASIADKSQASGSKSDAPVNLSAKVIKDMQNSGQSAKKNTSASFGFSFRKTVDVRADGQKSEKARGDSDSKASTETAGSSSSTVKQSINTKKTVIGTSNKPSSSISTSSTNVTKSAKSVSEVNKASSGLARDRPKGITKVVTALQKVAETTGPAHSTRSPSANSSRSCTPTTEPHVYSRIFTEEDELDPDFFKVGTKFSSYEDFEQSLPVWHDMAYPDDVRRRYTMRKELHTGKPRINCPIKEKTPNVQCPFYIRLHSLPRGAGFVVHLSNTKHSAQCNEVLEKARLKALENQASSSSDDEEDDELESSASEAATTSTKNTARRSTSARARKSTKPAARRKSALGKSSHFEPSSASVSGTSESGSESETDSENDSYDSNISEEGDFSGTRSWKRANKEQASKRKSIGKLKKAKKHGDTSDSSSDDGEDSEDTSDSDTGTNSDRESPASDADMSVSKKKGKVASRSKVVSEDSSDDTSSVGETSDDEADNKTNDTSTMQVDEVVSSAAGRQPVQEMQGNSTVDTAAGPSSTSMQVDYVEPMKRPAPAAATPATNAPEEEVDAATLALRRTPFRKTALPEFIIARCELHHIHCMQDMIDAGSIPEVDYMDFIDWVQEQDPWDRDREKYLTKVEVYFGKRRVNELAEAVEQLKGGRALN